MAILGAVQLVNLLFDIYTNTQEEITQVFQQYFAARSGPGKAAVSASNSTGYLMHKKVPFCGSKSAQQLVHDKTPVFTACIQ